MRIAEMMPIESEAYGHSVLDLRSKGIVGIAVLCDISVQRHALHRSPITSRLTRIPAGAVAAAIAMMKLEVPVGVKAVR